MNRRRSVLVPSLLVPLVLALGACGSDEPDDPEAGQTPSATTAPTTPAATSSSDPAATTAPVEDVCDVITDARLTELTGRPQTVGEAAQVGTREECTTMRGIDDALRVTWGFEEPLEGDPDYVLDSAAVGLERSSVDLDADGAVVPATLLTGEAAGAPTAKVVVMVDELVLVAEAASEESVVGGEGVTDDVLRDVVVGIAQDYLSAGLPATSAG